ncbi:hypothetical protein LTR56_014650 [Elasticomyces elasticus]|nr:hypothetical protein LTR56_014650 [Elasticomyces elasticus]KAK3645327.1 hypothetical protein LTR22_014792 [Elasticomyces elasticus]KAK5750098.1 hypothetical protein LTS12_019824 [Elasticomyces elasticus]
MNATKKAARREDDSETDRILNYNPFEQFSTHRQRKGQDYENGGINRLAENDAGPPPIEAKKEKAPPFSAGPSGLPPEKGNDIIFGEAMVEDGSDTPKSRGEPLSFEMNGFGPTGGARMRKGGKFRQSMPWKRSATDDEQDLQRADTPEQEGRRKKFKNKPSLVTFCKAVFYSWINIFLIAIPIGVALEYTHVSKVIIFAVNFVAIIPLAAVLSYVTEDLAIYVGESLGRLLKATLGDAVEKLIRVPALAQRKITFGNICAVTGENETLLVSSSVGSALEYAQANEVAMFVVNLVAGIPIAAMLFCVAVELAMCMDKTLGGLLNKAQRMNKPGIPVYWQPDELHESRIMLQIGGVRVACLPDLGAAKNIISLDYVRRLGINYSASPADQVTFGACEGRPIKTIGVTTLSCSFPGDSKIYHQDFHVMAKCIRDVILGSPFLALTQTYECHSDRLFRQMRPCPSYQVLYMGSTDRVLGMLNGFAVKALPDTGSHVMLMSEAYASRRGFAVNKGRSYQIPLQFADGTYGQTIGAVVGVQWAYGMKLVEELACTFYVLPGLRCDVVLSEEFLHFTQAFTKHRRWFKSVEEVVKSSDMWMLSTITKVPTLIQKLRQPFESKASIQKANAVATLQRALQSWEHEKRRLLHDFTRNEAQVKLLPAEQQDSARATFTAKWQPAYEKHMRCRPGSPPLGADGGAAAKT